MDELEVALAPIGERLRRWLPPVEPPSRFVRSLRVELVEAARRRQERAHRLRHILLVGAAILGSVMSVAGVMAFLLLRRRARAHPPVAVG